MTTHINLETWEGTLKTAKPKLDDDLVLRFEHEQQDYGTKVALNNLVWVLAVDILEGWLGISNIKTSYKRRRGKK
jgi:hypothetical protein